MISPKVLYVSCAFLMSPAAKDRTDAAYLKKRKLPANAPMIASPPPVVQMPLPVPMPVLSSQTQETAGRDFLLLVTAAAAANAVSQQSQQQAQQPPPGLPPAGSLCQGGRSSVVALAGLHLYRCFNCRVVLLKPLRCSGCMSAAYCSKVYQ